MQGVQTRSVVVEPAVDTYWPAVQTRSRVHAPTFVPVLYEPAAQGAQTRLARGVPSLVMNCPGVQVAQGLHVVAGLMSSSYVPLPEATPPQDDIVVPLQYVPGVLQVWQEGGLPEI
ncbi:MAG: hypothetical protein JWN04_490 [Myxococcaceae bacterium]|nr:hypothetical protein [Myxococcaceae bacterium]